MSLKPKVRPLGTRAFAYAILASAIVLASTPAGAATLAEQAAADRAALETAVSRFQAVQAEADAVDAQVMAATAALDAAIAEEDRCRDRLNLRVSAMYRTENSSTLTLILRADSLEQLTQRLDLLDRLARQDAANIQALKSAQAEARESAEGMLALQAEQARTLEALDVEVARARQELAQSEAALKEYEARMAAAAAAARAKRYVPQQGAPDQALAGTGDWQTGVASHYGINFTGRGASGEKIGPYSMMLAHKTLPFGTLIEFEYKGKRAVARVADRGPYVPGRDFDLGPGVVRVLGFNGVHPVQYRIVSQ